MKIGIDLSVLQTDHRFRGIGSVVINFINNLDESDRKKHSFVFFVEPKDETLAYEQLNLEGVTCEVQYLHNTEFFHLPGRLDLLTKIFYKTLGLLQYYTGDPRISSKQMKQLDRFIQFDQNRKLPRRASKCTVLFLHDLIPYVLESDYLWSYSTARLNGRSRKGAIKFAFQRLQYVSRIRINTRRAKFLIANSEHTKNDFIRYIDINPKKIRVTHLGINPPPTKSTSTPTFYDYRNTTWGVVKQELDPSKKPYLLFIGGTDHRRKMVELIAAFNNLKARGVDVSLIIAGDSVEGINDIKNPSMKKYLEENTSYIEDIHLLGYTDNQQRDWLYEHTLAFVFPSVYEGFGLPVLEAMSYGAPVITYNNTSISEVSGSHALYANDFLDIARFAHKLLLEPDYSLSMSKNGSKHAKSFTWAKTKSAILEALNP